MSRLSMLLIAGVVLSVASAMPRAFSHSPAHAAAAPANWQGSYFNNDSFSGTPALTRDDGPSLDFAWTNDLAASLNPDGFSATWRQFVATTDGVYQFALTHDDGVRLFIDGELAIDHWFTQATATYAVDLALSRGMHVITLDYYHRWGPSAVTLRIAPLVGNSSPGATSTASPQPTATSTLTSRAVPSTPAPTATSTPTTAPASPTIVPVTPAAPGPSPIPSARRTPALPPPAATQTPTPAPVPAPAGVATNGAQTMVDDATLPHEGCLDRNYVDGFSWQDEPDTGWWNPSPPTGYGALTGWFAITTDASPSCTTQSPVANVRVEVRNYRTYALANGIWELVQDQERGGISSALFFPDYQPGWGSPNVRSEPDGGQSWLPGPSGLWHGWPGARAAIPDGTTAVCSRYEARLVLDDPAGPDNRSSARMLAEAGFDWWQSTSSGVNDLGMNGRYKLVPPDGAYRWFNGCGAPAATLLSFPPPYE